MSGTIVAVCTSHQKGTQKVNVGSVTLIADHGIQGDAHAGPWHRQVSLLADESIEQMRKKGLDLSSGDFGENIVTRGINLLDLGKGSLLQLGDTVMVEVTQIGKTCHQRCAIYYQAGDCIMPREGVFVKILEGGTLSVGDAIKVIKKLPPEGGAPESQG